MWRAVLVNDVPSHTPLSSGFVARAEFGPAILSVMRPVAWVPSVRLVRFVLLSGFVPPSSVLCRPAQRGSFANGSHQVSKGTRTRQARDVVPLRIDRVRHLPRAGRLDPTIASPFGVLKRGFKGSR